MSRPIHRFALAAALLCAPALTSHVAAAPPDVPDSLALYLGTADDSGAIADCRVTPAPRVEVGVTLQRLAAPFDVELAQGARLRAAPTASAAEVGRRTAGSHVTIRALHVSGAAGVYYVWALVEPRRVVMRGYLDRGRELAPYPPPQQLQQRSSPAIARHLVTGARRST